RTPAPAPPSPTVDRVLHTSWGHIPRRRQPPPGLVVRAPSMAPFQGVFPREALCSWRGMAGSRDGETPSRIQHNGSIYSIVLVSYKLNSAMERERSRIRWVVSHATGRAHSKPVVRNYGIPSPLVAVFASNQASYEQQCAGHHSSES